MRTLLIDSEQLDSGEAISKEFREAAAEEIERFRAELIQRTGDVQAAQRGETFHAIASWSAGRESLKFRISLNYSIVRELRA